MRFPRGGEAKVAEASKEIIKAAKKGDLAKLKWLVAMDAALVHANDTGLNALTLRHLERTR